MISIDNGLFLGWHRTAVEKLFKATFLKSKAHMNAGQAELGMLAKYIPKGSTTIDVGANVGDFSRRLSELSGGGMVLAFEPQSLPRSVMTMAGFFRRKSNITVQPLALGDHDGMVTLNVPIKKSKNIGVGLAHIGDATDMQARFDVKHELVPLTTLDKVVVHFETGPISFIKIDVEGGELDVLRGAEQTIAQHRPVILCEVEAHQGRFGSTVEELAEFFRSHRYVPRSILTDEILPPGTLDHNTVFTPEP
jgi:FkbM family methyltransferase